MRGVVIILGAVILSGCGVARQLEQRALVNEAKEKMLAALSDCAQRFPAAGEQFVAKAKCDADAVRIMRPFLPYPELQDQEVAVRAVVAERLQNRQMTKAEAELQIANATAQIAGQIRDRALANRAVLAQEATAIASRQAADVADRPRSSVTCVSAGGWLTCN